MTKSDQLTIIVPRWNEFQHYKDREPKWIKVYTRLHSDDSFLELTGHQRAVLIGIWVEAARSGVRTRDTPELQQSWLRVSRESLARRLALAIKMRDLKAIETQGFIQIMLANQLAERPGIASLDKKREEKSKPLAVTATQHEESKPANTETNIDIDIAGLLKEMTG